jgi:hypothetical protein
MQGTNTQSCHLSCGHDKNHISLKIQWSARSYRISVSLHAKKASTQMGSNVRIRARVGLEPSISQAFLDIHMLTGDLPVLQGGFATVGVCTCLD